MGHSEIIKIEKLKRNNYLVTFDSGVEMEVHDDSLVKHQLYKEKQLSDEEIQLIKVDNERQSIIQVALRLISFRSRTTKELRSKLKEKGYGDESINETLTKLELDGYINHREYAQQFLHDAIKLKKKGLSWARFELSHRGIEEEFILDAIQGMDAHLEYDQFLLLTEKKWNQLIIKYGNSYGTKQRLRQFLERKGCSKSTMNQILKTLDN